MADAAPDDFNQAPPLGDIDLFTLDLPLREAVAANGAGAEAAALSAFGRQWGRAELTEQAE
jgi:putative acyl-CoA dehydrogenase